MSLEINKTDLCINIFINNNFYNNNYCEYLKLKNFVNIKKINNKFMLVNINSILYIEENLKNILKDKNNLSFLLKNVNAMHIIDKMYKENYTIYFEVLSFNCNIYSRKEFRKNKLEYFNDKS
jgi:hypothetical protein